MPHPTRTTKLAMRDQLLAARRRIPVLELGAGARATAEHLLAAPEVRRAATVAAYVSVSHEPGTGPLLDALAASGRRVLLPVVTPEMDLDWAAYAGPEDLRGARGLLEPAGPRLGLDAVAGADVVVVPGLAVDGAGNRLGKGAGCYDRALARVPSGTFTCVVLHRGEVLDHVPAEPHDRPVAAAVTPDGLVRLAPGA